MKHLALLIVAGLLVAAGAVRADETEPLSVEIYPLGSCDPAAAEETARSIVSPGGTVILDRTRLSLIVAAKPSEHKQIKQVLEALNVPAKNVRIDVRFQGRGATRDTEVGIHGQGGVVIRDGKTHATAVIKPELRHETTEMSSDVTQTILVGSGREGRLEIGEQVPYLEWILDYGYRWGILREQVNWQRVGSHLVVAATVIGDGPMISVRLIPELSGMVESRPHQVRFARAATEVTVQDGQTIRIGGLNKDEEFYSRFLVGFSGQSEHSTLDILLTPHI
ncbi:MAG: hypothetical protein JXB04_03235, partial [Kiritimatiellae bacterium]|nr:hypothetical protein [Kiritimatiellia bacterium]